MCDAEQLHQPVFRHDGVKAAAVAARTDGTQRVDLDMADFTGQAGHAMHDFAVDDDACANPVAG